MLQLALISVLMLQGCVAAAILGTVAIVSTKAAHDPRTIGTQVDDSTLALRISRALSKDEQVNEARIKVTAYQGKVLLAGQSPNTNLAARAKQIAMGVEGTSEVYNEIRHCKPISLGTAWADTWITIKVSLQLLDSDQVKSSNVKVSTENGEVFLLGMVTEREGRKAADIASHVRGVTHVITAFTYKNSLREHFSTW